jgi:hypothetical protein
MATGMPTSRKERAISAEYEGSMKNSTCSWTELVYRVGEHYAWEPHWTRPANEFRKVIRRQEPPLNVLFLLLLRLSAPETMRAILAAFGLNDVARLGECQLQLPVDAGYTQPDVCVESDTARVFIELKLNSTIDLQQVQKYLLLHAGYKDEKQLWLLFLTKAAFVKSWTPRQLAVADVQKFLSETISSAPIEPKLAKRIPKDVLTRYEMVKRDVRYGSATWMSVGKCLANIRDRYQQAGGRDIEVRILADFLADLKARGLMVAAA